MKTQADSLASRAEELASLLVGDAPRAWRHTDLVLATTALIRSSGAAVALEQLRVHAPQHHETLAAFSVWAIDRLLDAGLTTMAVLWHPLTDRSAALSWWTIDELRSDAATHEWLAPTLGNDDEPRPTFPGSNTLVAA